MEQTRSDLRGSRPIRLAAVLVCSIALTVPAAGQSGRRVPKRSQPAPTQPSTQPEAPETPSPKPEKPQTRIVVTKFLREGSFTSFYANTVVEACLVKLKESAIAEVTGGREMNRKEATDYAKNSTDTYVVWLEVALDYTDPSRPRAYEDQIVVSYTVFEPRSAKTRTHGRVYQSDYRRAVGGVVLPVPNTRGAADYALKECGREIGKRVLDSLNLGKPPL